MYFGYLLFVTLLIFIVMAFDYSDFSYSNYAYNRFYLVFHIENLSSPRILLVKISLSKLEFFHVFIFSMPHTHILMSKGSMFLNYGNGVINCLIQNFEPVIQKNSFVV